MKKVIYSVIILAIISFLLFMIVDRESDVAEESPYPATPSFSATANDLFRANVTGSINLNSGITMERSSTSSFNKIDINSVTFAVFNHTDEPITFPNEGFGISVFRYDEEHKNWEELTLQHVPRPSSKTLPPKIEKWDFEVYNVRTLLDSDLIMLKYDQLRLYVSGIGDLSNKEYGAYIDVTLAP